MRGRDTVASGVSIRARYDYPGIAGARGSTRGLFMEMWKATRGPLSPFKIRQISLRQNAKIGDGRRSVLQEGRGVVGDKVSVKRIRVVIWRTNK